MRATLGGICVGYGGLEMAIEQLMPVRHAWHVEFDEAASKVLEAHWPEVPNYGDVTKVDWTQTEPVEVFAGGIPCQGHSLAGKRLGSDDDRDLWPVRKFEADGVTPRRGALDAIRQMMPLLVVIENVRGLLTSRNGQDFATILADLDDLGYTVSWTVIGACKVGACHHRHRVFIAATLVDTRAPLSDPVAHRSGGGWSPAQFVLFGGPGPVIWPPSGFTSNGTAWELPVDTCGIDDSLALPTPRAIDGETAQQTMTNGRTTGDRGPRPGDIGQLLPTPRTSDTNGAGHHGSGGMDLRTAVSMLPTPKATDVRRTGSAGELARKSPALGAVVELLPTPTVADSRGTRNATAGRSDSASPHVNNGWTLSDLVFACQIHSMLPTPVAGDADRASRTYSRGNPTLLGAMLPTPTVTNWHGNEVDRRGDLLLPGAVQPERFGKYADAVNRHEQAFGLVAPDPTEPGRNGKPRLSAAFPEFMQGLPPGWLTDVVDRKAALKLAGNGVNPRQAAYALPTLPTFTAAVKTLAARNTVAA